MENKIKEVLDSLVAGIDKEIETEYSEIIDKLLNDTYLDWKDPDNTNVLYFYESTKFIPHLLKRVYPEIDGNALHRVCFVYEQYDYLDHNIRPLVDMGVGCCADKTRWVIRQYLNWCLGDGVKEIPHRHSKDHRYSHPDFGDINHWMSYLESLYQMYYKGFNQALVESYNLLSGMKKSVETVIHEENKKINFFYAGLADRIDSYVKNGKISREEASAIQKLEITENLIMDIIQDTLTEEKILKVIKENMKNA